MSALAVGVATYTRHDAHTRHLLDEYRKRREQDSDAELLRNAYYAETLSGHGIADELRSIVDHEVEYRRVTKPGFADWWTAAAAEVTR